MRGRRGEGGARYLSAVWPLAAQNPGSKFFFLERRATRTKPGFGLVGLSTRPRLDVLECPPESLDAYWCPARCWEQKKLSWWAGGSFRGESVKMTSSYLSLFIDYSCPRYPDLSRYVDFPF